MILVLLVIGAILIVAAIRNSQGALFTALATDAPGYVIWAAAILAIGAVGYVPDLKPVSRGLLALIILVIVLKNYQTIIAGFQGADVAAASSSASNAAPAASASSGSSSLAATASSITKIASAGQDLSNAFGPSAEVA